ncbi:ABC transporter substrate-binding protein [Actinokineospora xionganensis]|uniref:Amino acid ABC transporter substrate-binding protein n=1 Tax=Actinokineospora xionganensis TaxID=2684470 RepID=A0ABR7L8R8_9PSEU|nr:ABC transporter substrate-binding protein [Actinokineospora xionganensis]MBC6449101.1 amino acid ABC transporter substrate-binding protein [Actinokineospora xionganensis]
MAHRSKLAALALLPALTLVVTVGACAKSDTSGGGSTSAAPGAPAVKLVKAGQLTTCTSLPYPPFQTEEGGKIVGFDVDLVDLAAKKLNTKQEFSDVKFDVIKSGAVLNANQCDVAAAGMTITEERKANLDFSNPYFDEVLSILTKKGGAKTLDEVKSQKLRLGVQTGTTSLDLAKDKGIEATEFDDAGKQLLALQSGQIDVILQDLPVVNDWLKKPEVTEKFELGETIESGNQYGFAVKKGNAELLKVINESLDAAIKDGTWAKTYKQWIGSEPKSTPKTK